MLIAKEIKQRIQKKVNLTASAGVSINKFLAKIASDLDKPNGLHLIVPEQAEAFLEKLPIVFNNISNDFIVYVQVLMGQKNPKIANFFQSISERSV